jgi:anti-sigma-K factor RskA
MSREQLLDLIPAYTLGALTEDERTQVEALLAADAEAQTLLREHQQIADLLPLSAPLQAPPAQLLGRLLTRLAEDRAASPAAPVSLPTAAPSPTRRLRARWLLPAAAALLLVILAVTWSLQNAAPPTPQALYDSILASSGAQQIALVAHLDDQIRGDLVITPEGDRAVIRVEQLPPLAADQAFQLWLIDSDGSVSGGVYRLEGESAHYISVPVSKPVGDYLRFGVSLEPVGGSPLGDRPSGPRVFDVTVGDATGT